MWILNFLPTWISYAIALLGAAGLFVSYFSGLFARFIPQLYSLKIPLQIFSLAVLVFGIYLIGGVANQEMWEARVKEMQAKVELAEEKARNANSKIEYKFLDKVKVVNDVQVVVQERIKEVATVIDSQCKLTPEAVELINAAAKNRMPVTNK